MRQHEQEEAKESSRQLFANGIEVKGVHVSIYRQIMPKSQTLCHNAIAFL
jgi:hypothetical protein